eukprot:TRINITY_DN2372_c0_g2_i2.p1 TRINITY_DN2372_c0_g2~~TRINITY_DN2372_c0_g2_i2.p1  ORF type:complete len:135 (-),score=54.29 TRINITY_DN2372_c0_g2_i2:253-612(-)
MDDEPSRSLAKYRVLRWKLEGQCVLQQDLVALAMASPSPSVLDSPPSSPIPSSPLPLQPNTRRLHFKLDGRLVCSVQADLGVENSADLHDDEMDGMEEEEEEEGLVEEESEPESEHEDL